MAGAPHKVGLKYFSHDTDLSHDSKIEFLEAECGIIGYAIYLKLLEKIYNDKGYYLEFDGREISLFAKKNNVDKNVVSNVINVCINEILFNEKIYTEYKVLTSQGIQKRYLRGCDRRTNVKMKNYLLLSEDDICDNSNSINVNIGTNNVYINSDNADKKAIKTAKLKESKLKESKLKESKLKESKLKKTDNPSATSPSDFDFTQSDWWINRAQISFKTVRCNRNTFAQIVSKLRLQEHLSEDNILKIQDFLSKPSSKSNGFSWFNQIGTPAKLLKRSKNTEMKFWEMILKEIENVKSTEKPLFTKTGRPIAGRGGNKSGFTGTGYVKL